MTSWRDSTSRQVQDELDGLLDVALPFAEKMLDQHGEFFPYAFALGLDGDTRVFEGDPGHGEQPSSTDVLALLVEGLRSNREDLVATAIVSDVRISKSDAVRVELEHSQGPSITSFLPYKKKRLRRGVDYGDLTAESGQPAVWS